MRQFEVALRPEEELLTGRWVVTPSGLDPDATCKRIEHLTSGVLKELAQDSTGWASLFRDPADGRLWERYYPQSEFHGGGPPSLRHLTTQQAALIYEIPATQ
jgi:hypothetical protein